MYLFNMFVQCTDRFLEVLPEELEMTKLAVEHLINQVLHELFGAVVLEHVAVRLCSQWLERQSWYAIDISAQCSNISIPWLSNHLDTMELTLEGKISCVLIELFGTVYVDRISVKCK